MLSLLATNALWIKLNASWYLTVAKFLFTAATLVFTTWSRMGGSVDPYFQVVLHVLVLQNATAQKMGTTRRLLQDLGLAPAIRMLAL